MKAKNLKQWRQKVLARDNYACRNCGAGQRLIAHHIKSRFLYPFLKLEVKNGKTLCRKCHNIQREFALRLFRIKPERTIRFQGETTLLTKKLIERGVSRAIIIPAGWLAFHEEDGQTIKYLLMEINNEIIIKVPKYGTVTTQTKGGRQ